MGLVQGGEHITYMDPRTPSATWLVIRHLHKKDILRIQTARECMDRRKSSASVSPLRKCQTSKRCTSERDADWINASIKTDMSPSQSPLSSMPPVEREHGK